MWMKAGIFLVGLILGYALGLFEIHQFFFNFPKIPDWFLKFYPKISFLSDVAAFEGVILALLIPLSIDIVSKISERYKSDIIINTFESPWWNRLLPAFLLINIVLAIVLRFFIDDKTEITSQWKCVEWMLLIFLVFIAFVVYFVIQRISNFIKNTDYTIDQLFQRAERLLEG